MKKSKVAVAIALAVILVILCVSVPTFSWFSRGHSLSGEKMMLESKNTYTGYNGKNVTIATYSSSNGFDYNTKSTVDYSGSGINPHKRNFFRTTITNGNASAQDVSLYVNTLSIPTSGNGTLALGVNYPTRSYRDYTALAAAPSKKTTRDMMRIYFEKDNNVTGWNGTEFYVVWNESTDTSHSTLGDKGQNGTYTKLKWVGDNNNGNSNRYYADIPITATHAFFCVENWGTNNNNSPNWWQRSQELINLASDGQTKTNSVVYTVTNTASGNNAKVTHANVGGSGGACINHYYDSIFVSTGGSFDAALTNTNSSHIPYRSGYNTNFTGTLHYYSSNSSVFTVDESTGVITPVGPGTATLYTKSVGYYTDTQQVETTVTVTSAANYVFYDVPIVRNLKVPAGETVNVDWYVINNSDSANLSYTIDSLYVGM